MYSMDVRGLKVNTGKMKVLIRGAVEGSVEKKRGTWSCAVCRKGVLVAIQ